MQEEKIYSPEVLEENPFPDQQNTVLEETKSSSTKVYTPTVIKQKTFNVRRPAIEVLSSALNTQARRILDAFQFAKSGALQIGEYISGLSGDIRISPNGITARDSAGNTSFNLDGITGNATFRGEVRANDFVISDENGLISLSSFVSDTVHETDLVTTTSSTLVDIPDTSIVIPDFGRPVKALVLFTVQHSVSAVGAYQGQAGLYIALNGAHKVEGYIATLFDDGNNAKFVTSTTHLIIDLPAGENTLSAKYSFNKYSGSPTPELNVFHRSLSYLVLGR